jgi:hypothetical protein
MRRRDLVIASLALPLTATRVRAEVRPVVLELFTSQGCSSCPPADALLGELSKRPGVIGLAWHVDYWNSLGWKDPYAKREWTERQKAYARYLNGEVYTPALVVNGASLTVGSDTPAVTRAISEAATPAIPVALRRTSGGLEIEIGSTALPVTGLLISYDPVQTTSVVAGENGGRKLVEYRVVREAIALEKLAARMSLPSVPENRGAVVLLQDASWRVLGAADLPPGRTS